MKSIEQRAKEYAKPIDISDELLVRKESVFLIEKRAFVAGAHSEHAELTRWNDPNSIPNDGREVLVKGICGTGGGEFYAVAYKIHGVLMSRAEVIDKYDTILGWREIHE